MRQPSQQTTSTRNCTAGACVQAAHFLAGAHALPGAFQDGQVGPGLSCAALAGRAGPGADADDDVPGDAGHATAMPHVAGPADPHLAPTPADC
jgi:hypothetical protein